MISEAPVEGDRPVRVKKTKTYDEEDIDPQNQPYKKKKKSSKDSKAKKSIVYGDGKYSLSDESQLYSNIMKRPRGRPPLISNKIKIVQKPMIPPRTFVNSSSSALSAASKSTTSTTTASKFPVPSFPLGVLATEPEVQKVARPNAAVVAHKVFAKLITSDPLSTADLTKILDAPRDLVQSVLDILQTFGVVISLKVKDGAAGSSVSTSANLYTLVNFTKSSTPIQLTAIADEVATRIENCNRNQQRIRELQELTSKEMPAAERQEALRVLIDKFLLQQPNLWDDPLYRSIIEHTGNTFQFSKSAVSSPRQ